MALIGLPTATVKDKAPLPSPISCKILGKNGDYVQIQYRQFRRRSVELSGKVCLGLIGRSGNKRALNTFAASRAIDAALAISYPKKWKHRADAMKKLAVNDGDTSGSNRKIGMMGDVLLRSNVRMKLSYH